MSIFAYPLPGVPVFGQKSAKNIKPFGRLNPSTKSFD
jgi:hypothetical protein